MSLSHMSDVGIHIDIALGQYEVEGGGKSSLIQVERILFTAISTLYVTLSFPLSRLLQYTGICISSFIPLVPRKPQGCNDPYTPSKNHSPGSLVALCFSRDSTRVSVRVVYPFRRQRRAEFKNSGLQGSCELDQKVVSIACALLKRM